MTTTDLLRAIAGDHVHDVARLLEAGAAVNQAVDGGATPLSTAAQKGHAEVASLLLAAGAAVMRLGFKLSRQARFGNEGQGVMDCWRHGVMPAALGRGSGGRV